MERAGHQVEDIGSRRAEEGIFDSWPSGSGGRRKAIRFPRRGSQMTRWLHHIEPTFHIICLDVQDAKAS